MVNLVSQIRGVQELRKMDHAILTVDRGREVAQLFSIDPPVSHFIVGEGRVWHLCGCEEADGVDAAELSEAIASNLGLRVSSAIGVGTRLRQNCDIILGKLYNKENGT